MIVRKNKHFYLFVSLADQVNYHVVVGRSDRITGPYLDRMGKPLLGDGGTPVIAPMESIVGTAITVLWWMSAPGLIFSSITP